MVHAESGVFTAVMVKLGSVLTTVPTGTKKATKDHLLQCGGKHKEDSGKNTAKLDDKIMVRYDDETKEKHVMAIEETTDAGECLGTTW